MQSMMWICRESRSGRISLHFGQACSGMFPWCCQSVPTIQKYSVLHSDVPVRLSSQYFLSDCCIDSMLRAACTSSNQTCTSSMWTSSDWPMSPLQLIQWPPIEKDTSCQDIAQMFHLAVNLLNFRVLSNTEPRPAEKVVHSLIVTIKAFCWLWTVDEATVSFKPSI